MALLGVNIDHVATVRQARREHDPDPVAAALICQQAGADSIVAHLREDRRHINDTDVKRLIESLKIRFNLEMSISPEIVAIACRLQPDQVTFVPERRQELTTEGGLDLFSKRDPLARTIDALSAKKVEVSLFIDPVEKQVREAARVGAYEIHTGSYANATGKKKEKELFRVREAARLGRELGLRVHAGHGLNYENVFPLLGMPEILEFNIGHSIVSRAVFVGLAKAVQEMKKIIQTRG